MRRSTLQPIYHREEYGLPLEREIIAYFEEAIFAPLRAMLPEPAPHENNVLKAALLAGAISFFDGVFLGEFSADISKELRRLGAERSGRGFVFAPGTMPVPVRAFLSDLSLRNQDLHTRFTSSLAFMAEALLVAATGIHVANTVDTMAADLQTQFIRSVSGVDGLDVPAQLPGSVVSELRDQVASGTDFAVRNFTRQQINELRDLAYRNAKEGGRADRIRDLIEVQFGVARRKARVIAEAETSLAVSSFRRERYEAFGITRYVWETSHDERVRPTHGESNNHRVLDGRTFSWGDPPIVDSATGRRRHPGEDYGPCRCVARPVLTLA